MSVRLVKNPPGRLLAIGDIHGCLKQLKALVDTVRPTADDQLVFLGDYIDRGPDSSGVIDELLDIRRRFPATVYLVGNHEQMLLDFLEDRDPTMFLFNGGTKTLVSYQTTGRWPIPDEHLQFFRTLLSSYETDDFIFVHAGMRPEFPLAEQTVEDLAWIRQDFIHSDYDWGKTIVYGHTPLDRPLLSAKRIGLDTGCVYGRKLTCCDVITRQTWQA